MYGLIIKNSFFLFTFVIKTLTFLNFVAEFSKYCKECFLKVGGNLKSWR